MLLANGLKNLSFGYSAGADTARADPHCFVGLPNKYPNALKVRFQRLLVKLWAH